MSSRAAAAGVESVHKHSATEQCLSQWTRLFEIFRYDLQKQYASARHAWHVLQSRHLLQLTNQRNDMPLAVMKCVCVVVN